MTSSLPEKRKRSPSPSSRNKISSTGAGEVSGNLDMNFALKVAKQILQVDPTAGGPYQNVVCSPVSLSTMLCVLAAGSDGRTREQLLRVMERDSVEEVSDMASRLAELLKVNDYEEAPDINYANAVWVDHRLTLKKDFQKLLGDVYKTEARSVDFQNQVDEFVNEANLWAEKQTKGLIKQFISRSCIDKYTKIIFANALFFQGVWVKTFEPKYTIDDDFYLLDGCKVQVPFMRRFGDWYWHGSMEGCKIIKMPYRMWRGKTIFSMYIFLPEKKDGLPDLINSIKLDANLFKDQIQLKQVHINDLHIPKFDFVCDVPLCENMKHLGLTLPFDEARCELTKMVDSSQNDLYVSNILQKCRIETNEQGTKAGVISTFTLTGGGGVAPPPINFIANHPFMFMIREEYSGAILFVGNVLDPLSN